MAKCDVCEREMLTAKGCVEHVYLLNDDSEITPIKVGEEGWINEDERCPDCNALFGEYHHIGCDIEKCNICHGQYISCDCDYSDKILLIKKGANKND